MASSTGERYEETKDMDMKQIAKLVRADIRAAKKAGQLPACIRVSARSPRGMLHVGASNLPFPAWTEFGRTREADALVVALGTIVGAYNKVYYEDPYCCSERFGSIISAND